MENNINTENKNSVEEKHNPWKTLLAYLVFIVICAVLALSASLIKSIF